MSRFGAIRGVPEYDTFRTGLTFRAARRELTATFKHRRRRTVLGAWHCYKLDLWYQATGQRLG